MNTGHPDVEAMLQAAWQVDWSSWQPDPADESLTTRVRDDEPPLTEWTVGEWVGFASWLGGHALTQEEIAQHRQELIEMWTKASTEMDWSAVHNIRGWVALWRAIQSLPENEREGILGPLRERIASAQAQQAEREVAPAESEVGPLAPGAMTNKVVGDAIAAAGGMRPGPAGFF